MPSISGGMMKLDKQLTFSLEAECDKATKILSGFMHPHSPDTDIGQRKVNVIPNAVVKKAKGFAVFTVLKGKRHHISGQVVITENLGGPCYSWIRILGQSWVGIGGSKVAGRKLERTELYRNRRCRMGFPSRCRSVTSMAYVSYRLGG